MTAPHASVASSNENAAWLDAFATHLASRAPHTRNAYLRDVAQLVTLAGATPVARLARPQLMRFVATLHGRGLSGRSLARTLSAWRAFYRYLIERDASVKDDPCAGIKAPKSPRRLPSALSPEEAAKLVTIEGDEPFAIRDRALFELAYSSGLRVSELAQLDMTGCDLATGEVRVLGKGSKERIVPVGAAARAAVCTPSPASTAISVRHGMPDADTCRPAALRKTIKNMAVCMTFSSFTCDIKHQYNQYAFAPWADTVQSRFTSQPSSMVAARARSNCAIVHCTSSAAS